MEEPEGMSGATKEFQLVGLKQTSRLGGLLDVCMLGSMCDVQDSFGKRGGEF